MDPKNEAESASDAISSLEDHTEGLIMLRHTPKVVDGALKTALKKAFFFAMMCVSLTLSVATNALAQPTVGKTYKDFLPLGSGASVALPEGNWEATHVATWSPTYTTWEVFTLKNLQPNPAVAFLVVRQATRTAKWGNTSCAQKKPNMYYHNEHGTMQNATLNKCSLSFAFGNIAPLIDVSYPNWTKDDKDWWIQAAPGLKDLSKYGNSSMMVSQFDVQQYNGYRIRVEALMPPPKGFGLKKFRDDMDANIPRPESEMISMWNSIYIDSIHKSFFEKKPQPIMALNVPWTNNAGQLIPHSQATVVAVASEPPKASLPTAATPPKVEVAEAPAKSQPAAVPSPQPAAVNPPVVNPPVTPQPAPPVVVAAAPPAVPAGPSAAQLAEKRQAEQERKQLEEEKNKVTQQLESMRQMLAKLQKENEVAAANAKLAEASKAKAEAEAAKSKSAEAAVPAKPVVYANRKALVIGNDLYTDVSKLNNAAADANAMAIALEQVGYKVFKHLNLDEKKFKQAIRDFRTNVQGGDEVLVFYAGHGVQLGSANYLLPIDIKGEGEDQVKDEAILLQKILDELEDKKTKFALAVIDACRDNPFKTKGRALGGRGLAPTSAATGQMVMFSAGSGQQALDRLGDKDPEKNGLFTRIFVKEMMKPGVSVDRVLRNVRTEVVRLAKSVGHEQTPALYDQAIGEFYFKQ